MKGTKKVLSFLTALTLATGGVGTFSVSAVTEELSAETVESVLNVVYEMYDEDDPTCSLSEVCPVTCFATMETVENVYYVFKLQDGEVTGVFDVYFYDTGDTPYSLTYMPLTSDVLTEAIANGSEFVIGSSADCSSAGYWINEQWRGYLMYMDGVTYDIERHEILGGDPSTLEYAPYVDGVVDEPTDTIPEETDTTTTPPVSGTAVGDINLDGKVDITDAVLMTKMANGSVGLSDSQFAVADCNSDGEFGAEDALTLLKFLVHLIDTLPYTG